MSKNYTVAYVQSNGKTVTKELDTLSEAREIANTLRELFDRHALSNVADSVCVIKMLDSTCLCFIFGVRVLEPVPHPEGESVRVVICENCFEYQALRYDF